MMKDNSEGCGPKWGWARKGPGRGGPPWMRGAPFGPWARGGGPRPGRMFGQGDLKLLLLALIADKPSHGYDLIRTIETKFGGTYVPSPGTIYPTLTLLEEQELIAGETASGGKKSYTATLQGRQFLATNSEEVKALMTRIDIMAGATQGGTPPEGIMHAVQTLRHAMLARPGPWTTAEETRIRTILENAARQIMSGE